MLLRFATALAAVTLLAAVAPGLAGAATIFVNSSADDLTVGGDHCTLRDAIEDAVFDDSNYGDCLAGNEDDTITFQLPAGSTITLTGGELVLPAAGMANEGIDIQGPGADELTISGDKASRVFRVEHSGVTAPEAISGLTIKEGMVTSEGGGVLNEGDLALTGVVVEANEAKAIGSSTVTANGGGIANGVIGSMTLKNSTVAGNTAGAIATSGIATAEGGGVLNQGTLTVADSTIADNGVIAAGSGGSESSAGGGIANENSPLSVVSSTIADNTVLNGNGGGTASAANVLALGTAEFENTIVAAPEGATNCIGAVTSHGFNLEDEDTCGFNQATDQPSTDPKLAAAGLADNGGPTPTIALEAGSPALDQGLAAAGEATDQRGLTRPVALPGLTAPPGGDHADIGAFEQQLPKTTETTHPGGGGGATPTSTGPSAAPSPTRKLTVRISRLPGKTTKRRLTIHFHANIPGAKFRCAIDGARPRPCHSPFRTKKLGFGKHTFTVIATAAGQRSKPAKMVFRVAQPRKHH